MTEKNLVVEEFRVRVAYDGDTNLPISERWWHYEELGRQGRPCGMPRETEWDEQGRIIQRRYAHHGVPAAGNNGIAVEFIDPETGKRTKAWDSNRKIVEETPSVPDFRVRDWIP